MTSATFEELLVQLDHQTGQKTQNFCYLWNNVLHTQKINARKILKLYFSPQIAQAICSHWIWGSSILSNASTESNSYGRQ